MSEQENSFTCPFCDEEISMLLDLSDDGVQTYIEDCEVCCRPIKITYEASDGDLVSFQAEKSSD